MIDGARVNTLVRQLNEALVRRPWLYGLLMLVLYGGGRADYPQFPIFVAHPFSLALPPEFQFLYSSPFNLLIGAGIDRITGAPIAYVLTALLAAAALLAAYRYYLRRFPTEQRTAITFVILSTPIMLVLTKWAGKGDAFMLAAYLMLLARGGRSGTAVIAGFVMVTAHRETGLLILAGHCFLRRELPWAALLGGAAGVGALEVYHYGILPQPPGSRGDIVLRRGLEIVRLNLSQPFAHIAFGLTWFWMFAARRAVHPGGARIVIFTLGVAGVAFLVIDYTRDFVLLSTPLVLQTAEWIAADEGRRALPVRFPFPLLFLLQAQFVKNTALVDSAWGQLLM